jgi:hypothetical protein
MSESKGKKETQMDPPAVLIMRRKSVRQFSDGQRVALYYVDKLENADDDNDLLETATGTKININQLKS